MIELLTAAQMKAIETAAIESGEVTGLELMERAGRGVVEAVFEEWPELAATSHRAVVLCGPGNNGGDGFVVARLLKDWGWEVAVFLYGDARKLPSDAKVNYQRWREMGEVACSSDLVEQLKYPSFDADCPDMSLFVDAVFGTGLTRSIPEELIKIAQSLNDREEPERGRGWIVAVDIPSGLCADSGRVIGHDPDAVFFSDLTVSFHTRKIGHLSQEGPDACGKIVVADIGLPRDCNEENSGRPQVNGLPGKTVKLVGCKPLNGLVKFARRHKYSHGHALILSGGAGKTGAARLAARGALRIGAGMVTIGVPPSAQMEVAGQITALMLKRVEDGAALEEILQDRRINALCLGPGLGLERARELVPMALAKGGGVEPHPTVLDADALSAYADEPQQLFEMLHETCVLTPHGGEFARLFPDIAEKLNAPAIKGPAYSKVDATREAAKRAGCVVLFKGADTVIAAPDGRCSINSAQYERSAPWLATAGAGDVLAGFITGLMARGFAPMQAAEAAAWLHVECARMFGPGLIAEDLPEILPKVFRALGV